MAICVLFMAYDYNNKKPGMGKEGKNRSECTVKKPNIHWDESNAIKWQMQLQHTHTKITVKSVVNINVLVGCLHFSWNVTTLFSPFALDIITSGSSNSNSSKKQLPTWWKQPFFFTFPFQRGVGYQTERVPVWMAMAIRIVLRTLTLVLLPF